MFFFLLLFFCIFFFNDPATTEIYTLSLHDALPIWSLSNPLVAVELAAAVMADGVVVDQDKNSEDGADDNIVVAGDGETDDEIGRAHV